MKTGIRPSPTPAVNGMPKRPGLKIEDFELIAPNETFAARHIGCETVLPLGNHEKGAVQPLFHIAVFPRKFFIFQQRQD